MDYFHLSQLRKTHPAWRLLCAEQAPLVMSFLHRMFIEPNVRSLLQSELILKLEDFLYQLRQEVEDEDAFPKSAYAYLEDWAQNDKGWLRKFYPLEAEEAAYDLTPATEKAIAWLQSLQNKSFIGTESRLLTLFDLLKQIASGTEESAENRIAELKKQRAELDAQIAVIEKGDWAVMDDSGVKERFMQFDRVARELLGDFRQLEQNFRDLDLSVRETIATWEGSKGALLEQIFAEQDVLADSDQGKSFQAFWRFLMSSQSQQELEALLAKVFALPPVMQLEPDRRLRKVHYDWLQAGEQTQRMVQKLSSQLRQFLDKQAWMENKRLLQQLDSVLHQAVDLKGEIPESLNLPKPFAAFMQLELPKFDLNFPMERSLFRPPLLQDLSVQVEADSGQAVDVSALFEEVFVDELVLKEQISQLLQSRRQVNLQDVLTAFPLQLGVAELVGYLSIASQNDVDAPWQALVDDTHPQLLHWQDLSGKEHQAWVPNMIFTR
ncbi:MAG: DUF3375 domain-containing protein [Thiotrichales bacterium]|nr:DUF3375 domain-containing protein [Thiotrichales bacterium]